MKKSFKLININIWDINILLKWRNEINTRRNSISSKKIKFIQHKHWFTKRLKQKPLFFWKLKFNNNIIGFIRLDKKNRAFYLNYLIDKGFRNKGYGSNIIRQMLKKRVLKKRKLKILAVSKKQNFKSIKAILANNFYQTSKKNNIIRFKYENR